MEISNDNILKQSSVIGNIGINYDSDSLNMKLDSDNGTLLVAYEYFKQHKNVVMELIYSIIPKSNCNVFQIASSFIDSKVIQLLADNSSIEVVNLPGYILQEEDYLVFKGHIKKIISSGVVSELDDNFDEILDYNRNHRYLFKCYTYDELKTMSFLTIYGNVDSNETSYLRFLNDDAVIEVSSKTNFMEIVNTLQSLGKSNEVIIDLESDKEKFNRKISDSSIRFDSLSVKIGVYTYPLKDYVEYEKILYLFVKDAMNLSPFEKYIYAYDVAKKFKNYKEHKKDPKKARNIYEILFNNYLVCVGYSDLFGDLLSKLGICSVKEYSDVVLDSYKANTQLKKKYGEEWKKMSLVDKNNLVNEQKVFILANDFGRHARRLSFIKDEKYGIDGFYFADATWDNDLEKSYYNHLAMTSNEVLSENKKFKLSLDSMELFYIDSVEQFFEKFNIIIKRKSKEDNRSEIDMFSNIVYSLLNILLKLDRSFYDELKEKYSCVGNYCSVEVDDLVKIPDDVSNCLEEIARFIVKKSNKEISGETVFKAVKNVYDKVYIDGISDEQLNEMIAINDKRQEADFGSSKFHI